MPYWHEVIASNLTCVENFKNSFVFIGSFTSYFKIMNLMNFEWIFDFCCSFLSLLCVEMLYRCVWGRSQMESAFRGVGEWVGSRAVRN